MKIIIPILTLALASLACMTSAAVEEPTTTNSVQLTPTETAIPAAEPAAGAVFEIPTAGPLCARVTAIEALHLRDQPNEKARVLDYLHNGEQVTVIAYGPWWKIKTDKATGYANAKYLSLEECSR